MNNLISWYNQNRKGFWGIIVAAFVIILIAWRLMYIVSNRTINDNTNLSQTSQVDTSNLNSITLSSDKSAITGKRTTIDKSDIETIDKFFSFCNSGNIKEAYNLISNECKEEMFSEIKIFQEVYINPVFGNGKRNISVENWTGKIYMVTLYEDFLATGRYSDNNNLQDYVTVVKDNEGNTKLNINNYVGRKKYDKIATSEGIEIKLLKNDVYMDYEKYTFEIKNNSNYTALLGNIQDEENVSYLVDKNNLKYNAYIHELSYPQMEILGKQVKTITIKYFSEYSSTKRLKSLVFPKVYLNYELYNNFENKNNYTKYGTIVFEL